MWKRGAKRARTADLLNANQALSQLSYGPNEVIVEQKSLLFNIFKAFQTNAPPHGREQSFLMHQRMKTHPSNLYPLILLLPPCYNTTVVLVDRIFLLLAILFAILGIINGIRQQLLAFFSIIVCGGIILYTQYSLIGFIAYYISQDPTINFLILVGTFFLTYFALKNIIVALIYQNKSQKSSLAGHISGAIVGVINCWSLLFTLLTMAANHSHTSGTAHDIFKNSCFLSGPYYALSALGSWRPSKDLSKKLTKAEPPREG